jgi:hypothetical protein
MAAASRIPLSLKPPIRAAALPRWGEPVVSRCDAKVKRSIQRIT